MAYAEDGNPPDLREEQQADLPSVAAILAPVLGLVIWIALIYALIVIY